MIRSVTLDKTSRTTSDFLRFIGVDPLSLELDSRHKDVALSEVVRKSYDADCIIADEDSARQAVMFVALGWVALGKHLADGSRSLVDVAMRGDVISMGATEWSREFVTALSDVVVFELPGATHECLRRYPTAVCEKIIQAMTRRYARAAEHLIGIGRRDAVARTAHLLLELGYRTTAATGHPPVSFDCPLTQADLGDALGLTAVHVNRVLKELRQRGLVSFRNGLIELHDRQGLEDLAGFDTSYLSLTGTSTVDREI